MEGFNTAVTGAPGTYARGVFVPGAAGGAVPPLLPHEFWEAAEADAGTIVRGGAAKNERESLPLPAAAAHARGKEAASYVSGFLSALRDGVARVAGASESPGSTAGEESTNTRLRRAMREVEGGANAQHSRASCSGAGGLGLGGGGRASRGADGHLRQYYEQLIIGAVVAVGAVSQTIASTMEVPGLSAISGYAPAALSKAFGPKLSMLPTTGAGLSLTSSSATASSAICSDMDLVSLHIQ